jgi:hypothetical protein
MSIALASKQFNDPAWRLNNLYYVVDKNGHRVKFEFNLFQKELFDNLHYHNVILKARQLGISTFCSLFMLDRCIFNSNIRAGTVAHDLPSAKGIFRDKIRYPYENLPDQLRTARAPLNDSSDELLLSNNSSLRVATSMRSGTLNFLHVSEFGKLCARFPDRAREVISGSLNTLSTGMVSFFESTAEGQEGKFFDLCALAQTKQRMGVPLTPLDFRFHFFPWWRNPEYAMDPIPIPNEFAEYFDKLELAHNVILSLRQRSWYVLKAQSQQDDVKREYPATPDEAFEAAVEGTYYGQQIAKCEMDGRIGSYPPAGQYAVNTAWDIGESDATAIWFFQFIKDTGRIRFLAYYENDGEGAKHYADKVVEIAARNRWPPYGYHFLPADVAVKEWGSHKTRIEHLIEYGIRPSRFPRHKVNDGINAVRSHFSNFEFDEHGCAEGLKALRSYRKEWNDERGCWKDDPRHDWASHGADALRYCTMAQSDQMRTKLDQAGNLIDTPERDIRMQVLTVGDPATQRGVSLEDLWELGFQGRPASQRI